MGAPPPLARLTPLSPPQRARASLAGTNQDAPDRLGRQVYGKACIVYDQNEAVRHSGRGIIDIFLHREQIVRPVRTILSKISSAGSVIAVCGFLIGCSTATKLYFPTAALSRTPREISYDVTGNGRADFALQAEVDNRLTSLAYAHEEDGRFDRIYRIQDYAADSVPHLIILLDSIPYQCVVDFYTAGHFSWFPPPQKVIAPFPSLSAVAYNQILQAPPLAGTNNYFYDQRINRIYNRFWEFSAGHKDPWQRYLHYNASYMREGLGFIDTRAVFRRELASIKQIFDDSPDRVTIVYVVSSASMVCRYGRHGVEECLREVERLCLQLLWERQGAMKISLLADHGHNLVPSQFVSIPNMLREAGYAVGDRITSDTDVVIDTEGLATFAGLHTRRPAAVADVLLRQPEMQLALYMAGDRVIVRDTAGAAAIEGKEGKLRYVALDRDVLNYLPVQGMLAAAGKADADGFISRDDWFAATVDHEWPDAPARIWEAFHGQVVCPSDLMITLKDGSMSGFPLFRAFIDMASSHGALNQQNTATFLLSMTGRATRPLRSAEILQTIEPGYRPAIRRN